jgi:hypothetical protein
VREQTITGHTQVFGLVGHPVRHSFSPAIYNTLFARFEIDAVYLAFDIHPDQADRVAEMIRVMGLVGVNLTVPFKEPHGRGTRGRSGQCCDPPRWRIDGLQHGWRGLCAQSV